MKGLHSPRCLFIHLFMYYLMSVLFVQCSQRLVLDIGCLPVTVHLTSLRQGLWIFLGSTTGTTGTTNHASFLHKFWGFKLRSSRLYCQHYYPLKAFFPAPKLSFLSGILKYRSVSRLFFFYIYNYLLMNQERPNTLPFSLCMQHFFLIQ